MRTRIIVFLALFAALVISAYFILKPAETLPIYHPSQLDPRLVDPSLKGLTGEHHIKDFNLIDQFGGRFTLADAGDRIIVADFFFTTCATICPKMTVQLERVQAAYQNEPRLLLLSHSVTPELDSVPVLAAYAAKHNANPERWRFLTGERAQIYDLARKSYFAVLDEGDGGADDFVHTENFVLVDPQRRLRGFYDGTSATDVGRLIDDIAKLLKELER
jgi:protein SCO1/2